MTQPHDSVILIVDDDQGQRSLLESFLRGQGFSVAVAASAAEALCLLSETIPSLLISDVRMPGMSGLELLTEARAKLPHLPVLLVTAYADVRDAVGAIRGGAVDYLEKPIDLDELLGTVRRTLGMADRERAVLPNDLAPPEGVVAQSRAMRDVLQEAALVAPSDTRVLITGESGVGKEVVTDMIHLWSPRASHALVKVNCAAMPENLLESELFGHEKGAFTGAVARRVGRFEEAASGTLFLDEIGEMSTALQSKLLRVTENGAFSRLGSNEELRTNARIIAATNRNLENEIAAGRFREDLYYRLNVIEIYVPALRERRADIGPLAQRFATEFSKGKPRFSPGAMTCLEAYDWPGNVRELRNAIERAVLLARGDVILAEHLPKRMMHSMDVETPGETTSTAGARMEDVERTAILKTLREHQFSRTRAARALGISRRTLTYRLQEYREQGYVIDPE